MSKGKGGGFGVGGAVGGTCVVGWDGGGLKLIGRSRQ